MICINSDSLNPFFNLAAEEYLLKKTTNEVFMVWVSDPAVIVGKHQNTYAEINLPFIKDKNINVARRLSGGGAVYHDKGNINFTFIRNGEQGKLINFKRFIDPVIHFLNRADIPAVHGEKNDILIEGKKVSGNAEHVYKKRILHHGTLLFNSDIERLNEAIKVKQGKYTDKAVQSKRSNVTNISEFMKNKTVEDFRDFLFNSILQNEHHNVYEFNVEEKKEIEKLQVEKYSTWEWIFGYSPDYAFTNEFNVKNLKCKVTFHVSKGIIHSASIFCNFLNAEEVRNFCKILNGKNHREDEIIQALAVLSQNNFVTENMDTIVAEFF